MKNIFYSITIMLLLVSCESEYDKILASIDDVPADKYYQSTPFGGDLDKIYGIWHLNNVFYNGLDNFFTDFDYLYVKEYGIYAIIKGDELIEYGRINVLEKISGGMKISFTPDFYSPNKYFEEYNFFVEVSEDSLNLYGSAYSKPDFYFVRKTR